MEEGKHPLALVKHHARLHKEAMPSRSGAATAPKRPLQAAVLPLSPRFHSQPARRNPSATPPGEGLGLLCCFSFSSLSSLNLYLETRIFTQSTRFLCTGPAR